MFKQRTSEAGSSLIETVIALGVLTVGALGAAAVFTHGMNLAMSSPGDLIATQKAAEAIESVFSARDSHTLTWSQIRNVDGQSGDDGGIFLDDPQPLKLPGDDGLINTIDDGYVETVTFPGPDGNLATPEDNTVQTLNGFQREIEIRDIQAGLRSITVIVTYQAGASERTYRLTTYISNFS